MSDDLWFDCRGEPWYCDPDQHAHACGCDQCREIRFTIHFAANQKVQRAEEEIKTLNRRSQVERRSSSEYADENDRLLKALTDVRSVAAARLRDPDPILKICDAALRGEEKV